MPIPQAVQSFALSAALLGGFGYNQAIACTVLSPELVGTYTGGCKDGLAHGFGRAVGRASYEGHFQLGKKHGQGKWTSKEGNGYTGGYEDDRRHGKGRVFFKDGGYIEANHIKGVIVGNVVYLIDNDILYRGPLRNGAPEGIGTLETKYGIYKGPFISGRQYGVGVWTRKGSCPPITKNQRCIMKMSGEFRNNALIDGAILHSDGYKYQGKVTYGLDGKMFLGVNQTKEAMAQRRGGDGPSIEMLGRAFLGISLTEVAESVARDAREGRTSSGASNNNKESEAAFRGGSWACSAEGPNMRWGVSRNEPTRRAAEEVALKYCNENQIARGACYIKSCAQKR